MSVQIKGYTGPVAEVDSNNHLKVVNPMDPVKSGFSVIAGEIHDGLLGLPRRVRPVDVSRVFRLRTGSDSILWDDVFNHGVMNVSKYAVTTATMTVTLAGGYMNLNAGNSVTSGNVVRVQTYRTFARKPNAPLYFDTWLLSSTIPQQNFVWESGLGLASGITTPLDGVYFKQGTDGKLLGVVNLNGVEDTVDLVANGFSMQANTLYHLMITKTSDSVGFWIDDNLYGEKIISGAASGPSLSNSLPILFRAYNAGTVTTAQQIKIAQVGVTLGDLNSARLLPIYSVGNGQSAISAPDSATAGQTSNYANTTAPTSATLSNTAAGYTTLGGQFQFAAVAGAETDYALFAYQVPAAAAGANGKNLYIRGIRIDTFNMGAAVATTATTLQWGLGIGSTAVSLVTTDSATAAGRAPRRVTLGAQFLPIATAIGYMANTLDVNMDTPMLVEAGTFLHVILKMPVGTATASQIIRGTVFINGFFE